MVMHSPPHPGRIVKQECVQPLGLTVTEAAKVLGVSRFTLSELVNGRRGISAEMAIRLAKAFGNRPKVWAGLQMQYELAEALRKSGSIKVERVRQRADH